MLSAEAFEFIEKNIGQDPRTLALKSHRFDKETMTFLLLQIKQKQKTEKKLPTFFKNHKLLFPTDLSAEQCSSEIAANYKASLFKGEKFIDLSGGLGIDTLALSKNFEHGIYCEWNPKYVEIVKHNFEELKIQNIDFKQVDGIEFLKNTSDTFDLIYLDPDRRQDEKRVFDFENCEPNILEHIDLFFQKSDQILIKASPMLDIHLALKQLKNVSKVWVVSHKNECKEILFLLEKNAQNIEIEAVELGTNHQLTADWNRQKNKSVAVEPSEYLYDPFVAFRKAELVDILLQKHDLQQAMALSILTSDELKTDFEGRIFRKITVLSPNAKELKKQGIKRANIISRGNNLDANTLHKQLKIERGGDDFLIALNHSQNKIELVWCKKISPNHP
jgi:precorrin-6B methylase 2